MTIRDAVSMELRANSAEARAERREWMMLERNSPIGGQFGAKVAGSALPDCTLLVGATTDAADVKRVAANDTHYRTERRQA